MRQVCWMNMRINLFHDTSSFTSWWSRELFSTSLYIFLQRKFNTSHNGNMSVFKPFFSLHFFCRTEKTYKIYWIYRFNFCASVHCRLEVRNFCPYKILSYFVNVKYSDILLLKSISQYIDFV